MRVLYTTERELKIQPFPLNESEVISVEDATLEFSNLGGQMKYLSRNQSFTKVRLSSSPFEIFVLGESRELRSKIEEMKEARWSYKSKPCKQLLMD